MRLGRAQFSDPGQHFQGEGIGQVAPETDDSPYFNVRRLPLQGTQAFVARGPGRGQIDLLRPRKALFEMLKHVFVCDQHGIGTASTEYSVNGPAIGGQPPIIISRARLSAIRSAEACTESSARCAYRAVVSICLCPSSLPIIGRLSPSAKAREA